MEETTKPCEIKKKNIGRFFAVHTAVEPAELLRRTFIVYRLQETAELLVENDDDDDIPARKNQN